MVSFLYTGNSFGKFRACPTCGKFSVGGLDRRSTALQRERGASPSIPVFTIAGGFEFASYTKRWGMPDSMLQALAKAYGLLGYDLGALTGTDMKYLKRAGATAPGSFESLSSEPRATVLKRGGVSVGVILLPEAGELFSIPAVDVFARISALADDLRPSVDIVVGLGGWGERADRQFMEQYPDALDVLLSSGIGTGYGVRTTQGARTLWVRPAFEGRMVWRLDLYSLPNRGGGTGGWPAEGDYKAVKIELGPEVKGDPAVSEVFAWL